MRERKRISRRGSGRHSTAMANGRGDPRDGRRENKRQTEEDLDLSLLETDKEGRITLKLGTALSGALSSLLAGGGLQAGSTGKLELSLGSSLGTDSQGRLAVTAGSTVGRLVDNSGGSASSTGTVGSIGSVSDAADAIATLSAKLNEALDSLDTSSRS